MTRSGIIVGVDGSASSTAAVMWAAQEACSRDLPLLVVTVVAPIAPVGGPWPEVPVPENYERRQASEAQGLVDAAVLTASGGPHGHSLRVAGEVMSGPVVANLVDISKQADMIVVGCRGVGGVSRALLGSVSSGLVHHAHCPVAVIHAEGRPSDRAPVVVGIDGSATSELATAIAFDEASRRGVDLVAVHAWSDTGPIEFASANWAPIEWRNIRDAEEEVLGERLSGYGDRYPDVTVHKVVVSDRPGPRLVEKAEEAQLLVLGSHGRGGFPGMLLGSVCSAVVNSAQIPVIIARTPGGDDNSP
ncbi:MAG: universal stress protein [Mycobacterium sp.]|nr:universal stress protein [Mycobacterium sp.]